MKLEKKPMELLIFLALRRGQLVSRQDIVAKLWRSDLFVDTEAYAYFYEATALAPRAILLCWRKPCIC